MHGHWGRGEGREEADVVVVFSAEYNCPTWISGTFFWHDLFWHFTFLLHALSRLRSKPDNPRPTSVDQCSRTRPPTGGEAFWLPPPAVGVGRAADVQLVPSVTLSDLQTKSSIMPCANRSRTNLRYARASVFFFPAHNR